jgi:hypothetical protein
VGVGLSVARTLIAHAPVARIITPSIADVSLRSTRRPAPAAPYAPGPSSTFSSAAVSVGCPDRRDQPAPDGPDRRGGEPWRSRGPRGYRGAACQRDRIRSFRTGRSAIDPGLTGGATANTGLGLRVRRPGSRQAVRRRRQRRTRTFMSSVNSNAIMRVDVSTNGSRSPQDDARPVINGVSQESGYRQLDLSDCAVARIITPSIAEVSLRSTRARPPRPAARPPPPPPPPPPR